MRLVVDKLRVFLVGLELIGTRAVLQLGDGIRRPHVLFATHAPGVFAAGVEHVLEHRVVAKGRPVHAKRFFGHLEHADATDLRGCAAKILVDHRLFEADGLEKLRAAVGHVGRHAHLGHDLRQSLADRLGVVVDRLVGRQVGGQVAPHVGQCLQRQIWVNRLGAVACQHREVVHLACRAGFHHQSGGGAQPFAHQMLMDRRQGQRGGNRHLLAPHVTVTDDQDVVAAADRVDRLGAQRRQLGFDAFVAPFHRVGDIDLMATELGAGVTLDGAQALHVFKVEHRLRHFQAHRRVHRVDIEQVGLGADEAHQRHHDGLADRIDRRIGDLREQLLEVVVERLVLV